ncbi:MAG: hypothetical protein K2P81_08825 [Bacteriovoracaceae bacterium]|nr:hypothetical protein [Bacteriovoracaceae bacterium]
MKGLILILIFTLAGCLPQSQVRTAGLNDNSSTTDTPTSSTSTSDVELSWYQSLSSSTVLNLYRDSAENTYVRGKRIENFLLRQNSPTTSYCLEIDMGTSVPITDKRYMRVRAVPLSVNNIGTGVKTIYLRVDFGNPTGSASTCALDKVQFVDDNTTQLISYAAVSSSVSYTLAQTCQSCVTQIVTNKFKLFSVDATNSQMVQVKPTDLNLDLISLSLQPNNAPNLSGTCTNSSCSALGYNCCLNNQCVNDGAVRSEVNVTSSAFLTAEQEKLSNPLAFLKYPQYYYICGTAQSGGSTGGTGSQNDANAAALARLQQMQKDYACIQLLKTNSTANPFHLAPYNSSATYDQSVCNTVTTTDNYYWQTVMSRLYTNCGCSTSNSTFATQLANCPKYDYTVLASDAQSKPIQFACTVLNESGLDTPFQKLDVAVNSRSVPHRFFNVAGTEINPAKNPPATTVQEGVAFSYSDPEKVQPNNGTFNMNSILGSFNINLTQSIPATVVDIELDNVYLIATRSGYYTPCPTCARDSWFSSFTATPSSGQGVGLQAVGHSTAKDGWDNNITLGNAEDTIFGRACWVPPTMLPFSQPVSGAAATPSAQRQLRLKTQAALYSNGYQRDWFGFNKGALIGSFDGVTWFAVGKGRIVRSTTKKLFLAINAPFGDLSENNNHVVSVQAYDGQATAAQLDFHPEYTQNHPNQNEAGNCQAYHRCNVDTDCVTKLGWEYACADVTQFKTYWPGFDPVGAAERLMSSGDQPKTVDGILAQGILPNGSTKRCVYRGAGAVCRTDSGSIPDTEMEKKKLLTCAPNFFCANVNSTNAIAPSTGNILNVFNKEVARYAAPLDEVPVTNNHFFGRDANFLGRPLYYVHNKNSTPISTLTQISDGLIKSTINANVSALDPSASGKTGICRPGKRLPTSSDIATYWSPFNQHQGLDEFSRTDFMGQIGSCPSNYVSINKLSSCPVFDDGGNYLHLSSNFVNNNTSTAWAKRSIEQNSCGLETLKIPPTPRLTADTMQLDSPFKMIEAKPLNSTLSILPGVTRDACLRKPGTVCHTDLDCSPNKLHSEQVQYFNDTYFGNSANREFYEQYLVCGQGTPKPYLSDSEFGDYDITKNRCCREVGKDITTYSAQEPSSRSADDPVSANIDPMITGTSDPTNIARYERFSSVRNLGNGEFPVLSGFDGRDPSTGGIQSRTYSGTLGTTVGNALTPKQWKTLDKANSKTCCGGGWVRKFSDGTTNWTKKNRLNVDVAGFKCLNYLSPLVTTTQPSIWSLSQAKIDIDFNKYCYDIRGATGNSAQVTIPEGSVADVSCASREYINSSSNPYSVPVQAQFSTLAGEVGWSSANNIFSFFPPTSGDTNPATFMDFSNTSSRKNITLYMPSYMGNWVPSGSGSVVMQRRDQNSNLWERTCTPVGSLGISGPTNPGSCPIVGGCCYEYSGSSGSRILKVTMNQTVSGAPFFDALSPTTSGRYGVKITYLPPGVGTSPLAKAPCKDVHYLDILGKLELAGIPQITYPKIVCNNNAEKLVPGIYDITETETNRASFNSPTFGFNDSVDWRTNYHGLQNGAVFSSHDFKCCTPAGKNTKDIATCCSGYGVEDTISAPATRKNYRCVLPSGTNLSVYFNRFVSNEGMSTELSVTPLVEADFNEKTGEPLITPGVNAKVAALGSILCEGGTTRRGGAFGYYPPEPSSALSQGETVYGIVDSAGDVGTNSNGGGTSDTGYYTFMKGFRWNHHLYCE